LAIRVAASYGLDVFDVQYRRESVGMVLRVMIDRPGTSDPDESITITECTRVSEDLSALLDVEDVLPVSYTLEVSSPGLDRPLRGAEDYRRFVGRQAKLVTREPVEGQSFFRGCLEGLEGDEVLIRSEVGRIYRVRIGSITRANLEVEF
jgi:ribosome maturation factor RimP